METKIEKGQQVKDQYGRISTVLWVGTSMVFTTLGAYHITKVFPVK
jgi:hypothetical protein